MPLYEYKCPECGHTFEVLQRMGEGADGLTCPRCQRPRPEKRFSTFASGSGSNTAAAAAARCGGGAGFT